MAVLQTADGFSDVPINQEIFDGTLTFDRFDPVLGTLQAVDLRIDLFFSTFGSLFGDPLGSPFQIGSASAEYLFTLDPGAEVLGFSPFGSVSVDAGPVFLSSFGPSPVFLTDSFVGPVVPVLDPAPFTGRGAVAIDYEAFAGTLAFGSPLYGPQGPFFVQDSEAVVTVSYTYDPVPGVSRQDGPGSNRVLGSAGFDTLRGGDGDDTLIGAQGADRLSGERGRDLLQGGGNDDTLLGGAGADDLQGGAGADVLDGGAGADVLRGGAGQDTASYASATRSVRVDLQDDRFTFGDAVGDRFESIEVFRTGRTADQLRGDAGDNLFFGGGFSDRLYGRAGDDSLEGEGGADALYGGRGADTMAGGDGAVRDRFIYFQIAESGVGFGNRDVIDGFDAAYDRIEISRFDADVTVARNQAFDWIGTAAFTGAAGQLRYESGANAFVQADVDGDGVTDFEITVLGEQALTADNFLL